MRGLFRLCGEHGSYFGAANSFAKLHGDRAVTTKAKSSYVIEVALAAPFCYRQNMISVPKTFADSRFESPMAHQGFASRPARTPQLVVLPDSVNATVGAHSPISLKDVFAQVPGLRTQLPLVYTIL
jgi:hypothetical protein